MTTTVTKEERPMSMQEVAGTTFRFQAAAEALAALGALLAVTDVSALDPDVAAALGDVAAAAGVTGINELPPPQRAALASAVRSAFAQAADVIADPTRPPGWRYTDPIILDGMGRGSAMIPGLLAQHDEFKAVSSFLDVGVGIAGLAIAAAQVWPGCSVVGLDVWEPALERARANVAHAGLESRIELRQQDVLALDDVDHFDLAWVPTFFFPEGSLPAVVERVVRGLAPGGRIVLGRYQPPPDPLALATLRLRTIRDGGSLIDDATAVGLVEGAGCTDVHLVPATGPLPLAFVTGTR